MKTIYMPPVYMLASLAASLGGLLNGFDTGVIGAVTVMPQFSHQFGNLSPVMRGFIVSLIMLASALSSLFGGSLTFRFSHMNVVGVGACVFTVGCALQGSSVTMPMFLCGRVLAGIGQGLWLANVNIYICEIAPSNYRGSLIALPQLMVTVGIFLSYFTCLGSVKMTSSMAWRSPYIIMGILSSLLGISCIFLPQSPRWLMLHHQREKAVKAIQRLDMDAVEAENYTMGTQETAQNETQCNKVKQLVVLFRPEYKSKSMLAAFLLLMIGLSGIDGILYYAPVLFGQAGIPTKTADFLASGCSAILMLAVSIPAAIFAEKWGRRTAMLLGGAGLSTCMFLMGSLYASNSVRASGVGRWFVIIFIFLFAAVYCVTWAVAGKIYASEILPTKVRAQGNSVGQGLNFLANWFVAFTTPIFLSKSSYALYFLYGSLSCVTMIVLALYMPETKGKSLEEIQQGFRVPTSRLRTPIKTVMMAIQ